jgi:protein-S-isoprenylcysteine O-methyltransferase Ste14
MSVHQPGVGSEHPLCDRMQLIMLIVFFGVWGGDLVSFYLLGYSTVVISLFSQLALVFPAILFLGISVYLVTQSHNAVFRDTSDQSQLLDSGVYSRVRHPMYLGILLFCLGFIFVSLSILSLGVWFVFFILYDKMTSFEEEDLIRIFGEEYVAYQQRVGKWIPH